MVIDYKLSIVTPQLGGAALTEADAGLGCPVMAGEGTAWICSTLRRPTTPATWPTPFTPWACSPTASSSNRRGQKAIHVPVSAVGRIVDAEMAARVSSKGQHGRHGCHGSPAAGRPRLRHRNRCREGLRYRQHQTRQGFAPCHPEPSVPLLRAERGGQLRNTRSIRLQRERKIAVLGGGPCTGLEAAVWQRCAAMA